MDDISAFTDLITSLRSAVEITKAIMDVSDANRLQTKILDLTKEIMSAQSCALATQSAQLDLLQSKRGLEDELAKLKTWNMEKYRYELQNVGSGAIVYVPKQSMRGTEPIHWICANCFQIGKKRFLNESHSDLHFVYHSARSALEKSESERRPRCWSQTCDHSSQATEPLILCPLHLDARELRRISALKIAFVSGERHCFAPTSARASAEVMRPVFRDVFRDMHRESRRSIFLAHCKSETLFKGREEQLI
jgi:hypothetical protein